ncbi:deoxyribonuclease IV [Mycoplasmopsis lipofaciens]|uniref:deoxyribonuclease IV n=1 Tax=Mycoplasmopsis lipofaciens TaxID=114884 RepID=UPI000483B1F4|nr:deoxyribonuclease IV [Mycoplasmopsis lipofaciens]
MIKLGSHTPFKAPNYLVDSAKFSIENGANTMMIYLGPPQNSKRISTNKYKYEEYLTKYSELIKPKDIIVHAPYIINPSNLEKYEFAIDYLIDECQRMNFIGAKYLVLHPGSYTKYNLENSLNCLIKSLNLVLNKTKDVTICIETMSGKGTEVGINLEQIHYILQQVNNERLQICLDTCHIWDAGYDLKEYDVFKNKLKSLDLLKHIKVIHLNDSKNDLGSHKDRHENIGEGFIGINTLAKFVHDKDFDNIPIILETPYKDHGHIYNQEINELLNYKNN